MITRGQRVALVAAECEENLAVRYLAGSLERAGHQVQLIAFNEPGDTEAAARALADSGAAVAGFSLVFTARAREFAAVARRARQLGYRGHVVAGGHFAAFNAAALLRDEPAFDSVAIGEGEALLCALLAHRDQLGRVRGLVWRDPAGRLRRNAPARPPADLDALPWPTRRTPPDRYLGLPIANVLGSRGCTHACTFCSISAWHRLCGGPRLRLRAPAAVAAEVAALYAQGYRIFNFQDDNFVLRHRDRMRTRVAALGAALAARGVGRLAFAIKSRADGVEPELFAQLKDLGLFRVFLGIEAGSQTALDRLGRRQPLAANDRALAVVNALDLHACFNLLLFNPDTTLADFRAHVAFLRAHAANPLNFCRTEVYAGTPIAARLRASGRLEGGYWGYGYRIADPQAQLAFELMRAALCTRHHGLDSLHHLTMRLDYEQQLLGHFFARPARLRSRVKDFIRAVNLDTAARLDELAAAAAAGFRTTAARDAFCRDLARRVTLDQTAFGRAGGELLAAIRAAATAATRRRPAWTRAAAAVGLAATLGFSAAALAPATAVAQAAGGAPPAQAADAQAGATPDSIPPAAADVGPMRDQLSQRALRPLVALLPVREALDLELWVRADGTVSYAGVYRPGVERADPPVTAATAKTIAGLIAALGGSRDERKAAAAQLRALKRQPLLQLKQAAAATADPEIASRCLDLIAEQENALPAKTRDAAVKVLRGLTFDNPNLRGRRFLVAFTADDLRRVPGADSPRHTHIFEMAPEPLD